VLHAYENKMSIKYFSILKIYDTKHIDNLIGFIVNTNSNSLVLYIPRTIVSYEVGVENAIF
jgi:hypothetical protein